jgi:hypothetical protein
MKSAVFVFALLLVISFSTGTAKAQCSAPTSAPLTWYVSDQPFSECVGSGGLDDYPYGDTSAYSESAHCSGLQTGGSNCGYCASPYVPTYSGICFWPPCQGLQNDEWYGWYFLIQDAEVVDWMMSCYPNQY